MKTKNPGFTPSQVEEELGQVVEAVKSTIKK
jgi:hypothetical protein